MPRLNGETDRSIIVARCICVAFLIIAIIAGAFFPRVARYIDLLGDNSVRCIKDYWYDE